MKINISALSRYLDTLDNDECMLCILVLLDDPDPSYTIIKKLADVIADRKGMAAPDWVRMISNCADGKVAAAVGIAVSDIHATLIDMESK